MYCSLNRTVVITVYVVVVVGDTAEFRCKVDGEPKPKVEWSKGKWRKLETGGKIQAYYDEETGEHVLKMADVVEKDEGTYTVTATNEHGTEQAPATLMVTEFEEEAVDWKAQLKHR